MSPSLQGDPQMSAAPSGGMSQQAARRVEYSIIALGVFALALIFQPFSLSLFGVGCALVVVAGLINNLLPLCRPGEKPRTLIRAGIIVALIFCIVLLLSLTAAYLYGVFFVITFAPDDSVPFYNQSFVWGVAVIAVLLAIAVFLLRPTKAIPG
jgi:CDP-diglyceride synthetase